MKSKITKALIYESQGLLDEALSMYKEVLQDEPLNKEASIGVDRVVDLKSAKANQNSDKLKLFFSENSDDIDKFKRWLVDI